MKEFSAPQTAYDERWFALVQPACAALARAAVLFLCLVSLLLARTPALVEGLAVMTAQGGVARFSLSAVQDAQVTVRSRAYLRVPDATAPFGGTVIIHAGSDVEVRVSDPWINARDIVLEHRGVLWPIVADGQGSRTVHREAWCGLLAGAERQPLPRAHATSGRVRP